MIAVVSFNHFFTRVHFRPGSKLFTVMDFVGYDVGRLSRSQDSVCPGSVTFGRKGGKVVKSVRQWVDISNCFFTICECSGLVV